MLPTASVDAIVTDPPYGLNFRGETWDGGSLADGLGFQAFTRSWAEQATRVLKPGGYLAVLRRQPHHAPRRRRDRGRRIGGARPTAVAVWQRRAEISAPAGRARLGVEAGLRADRAGEKAARSPGTDDRRQRRGPRHRRAQHRGHAAGRRSATATPRPASWSGAGPPTSLLGHHAGLRRDVSPDCAVAEIDRANPEARPSRFFYAAKASRAEREAGLDQLPRSTVADLLRQRRRTASANLHPTVKPIALMRWLVRLVVPAGGVVLDPFTGSGSTGIAAVLEGRQFLGVERETDLHRDRPSPDRSRGGTGRRKRAVVIIARRPAAGLDGPAGRGRTEFGLSALPVNAIHIQRRCLGEYQGAADLRAHQRARDGGMQKADGLQAARRGVRTAGRTRCAVPTTAHKRVVETGGQPGAGRSSVRRSRKRETTTEDAVASAVATLAAAIDSIEVEVETARERADEATAEYEAMQASEQRSDRSDPGQDRRPRPRGRGRVAEAEQAGVGCHGT